MITFPFTSLFLRPLSLHFLLALLQHTTILPPSPIAYARPALPLCMAATTTQQHRTTNSAL